MLKVQLLLTLRDDRSLNLLEARLVAATQQIRSALKAPGWHRRMIRLHDDPLAGTRTARSHSAASTPCWKPGSRTAPTRSSW